jgi:nucleoside-diphosphate-sugar epimerase
MKVAVFGSGGYIGRHLVVRLRRDGAAVVPFSSADPGVFDPVTGLLLDGVILPADTDTVVFLSQSPRFRQMPDEASHLWSVNVLSAMRAAKLARQSGVGRFVYASTGNVYAPSFEAMDESRPLRRDDWYALSKVHAEEALALYNSDMQVLSARIFGVYGPGQTDRLVPNLVQSLRGGNSVTLASRADGVQDDGGLRVSLCFIHDVVDIFAHLVGQGTAGAINIAGPHAVSIGDVAAAIGRLIGRPARFELASQPRRFDLIADVTKLVQLCRPQFTPFETGLRAMLGPQQACQA